MGVKSLLKPLLKWWWLMILTTAIAVVSAYQFTRNLPPTYQAHSTLVIGNVLTDPNGGQLGQAQQLAAMYVAIGRQDTLRYATQDALHMPELPDYSVQVVGNGIFIDIAVVDTDPNRAQVVANELAHQLTLRSPSQQRVSDERVGFVNQQLDELEASIAKTQADIGAKQIEISQATSGSQLSALQAELRALQDRYTMLQTTYGSLLATTPRAYINTISVLEPATLPQIPIGPNIPLMLLIAAAGGFVLGGSVAYLLEFLDDTLTSSEEISAFFKLPLIGYVPTMERQLARGLYVMEQPHSVAAEAFRALRTNLEFAGVDQPLKTILVTSVGTKEGKSTISTNLALTVAQTGKQVVLLDADLRWPVVHNFFSIPNEQGLSDVMRGQVNLSEAMHATPQSGVAVIPAGNPPPNPAEMLSSKKMEHILASLQEMVDVVVLDGPPFLVADAWILSAKVDGVILVVQPGRTSKSAARAMLDQLHRGRARILGLVVNRKVSGSAYRYHGYYSSSAAAETQSAARKNGKKTRLRWPMRWPSLWLRFRSPREKASEASLFEGQALLAERVYAERPRNTLDLFLAISRDLAAPHSLPDLLERLLQLTLEGLGASSGSMVVLDKAGKVVSGALAYAGKISSPTLEQLTDTVEHGLAGWVIEHREAALISSTRDDPRWLARDWDHNEDSSRSAISVPLCTGERVFGALTLVHPRAGQFDDDDLTLLKTVGVCLSFNPEAVSPEAVPVETLAEPVPAAVSPEAAPVETLAEPVPAAVSPEAAPVETLAEPVPAAE